MQTSTTNTDLKTDSKIPSPVVPAEESKLDDFGYAKSDAVPAESKIPEPKVEEEKPVEKKATGYEDKPEEPKIPEAKVPDAVIPDEIKELAEIVKDLPEGIDKDKIVKFATENKLSKEQLQAYSNLVKEDQKLIEDNQKAEVVKQRADWKKELTSDPEFGGENFDKNVDRVEKVLEKYMTNTKKVLTERGSMLPPYVMRDILALSKALNPIAPLVIGDAGQAESKDGNYLDEMYL